MTTKQKVRHISEMYDSVSDVLNALDNDMEKIFFIDQQIGINRTNQAIVRLLGQKDLAISIQATIDFLLKKKQEIYKGV